MLIIPAVDIKDGEVVRLWQGDFTKVMSYSPDPVSVARDWALKGAKLIHVVDLDGAQSGTLKNLNIVAAIAKAISVPVELGGGIRQKEAIEKVLGKGIARVILGTVAYEDPAFFKEVVLSYGEKVALSIDAKDGIVQSKGWSESTTLDAIELAKQMEAIGLKRLIYTDISRDGTLMGPNIERIRNFIASVEIEVYASGGIASLEDVKALKLLEPEGLSGIIIGKALYEGKIDFEEAVKLG